MQRSLLAWFRRNARDLPWRRTKHPYRVWLSEIMLQQTRVETVRPYYARFLKMFPTVQRLAAADEGRVLKLWQGLGYYSRARNLHAAAKIIAGKLRGRFPATAAEWQRLPGVGRYTAGAIASIAFGERTPVLDGNVKRVLARAFGIAESIDAPATQARLWQLAESLVPRRAAGDFNQAMMELGATVCTPRSPACGECPWRLACVARAQGRQADWPVRRPRRSIPHYEIVAALTCERGRYLLGRRRPGGLLGGLWELPGGKVNAGETHRQALRRELREELGVEAEIGRRLTTVDHAYSHFRITLSVYGCRLVSSRPRPLYHTSLRWVAPSQLDRYALPAATLRVFERLKISPSPPGGR